MNTITKLETPCIEWTGNRDVRGYGRRQTKAAIAKYGTVKLHRQVWIEANGPIPDGMCVCHDCDHPPCINVQHLFLGTHNDNVADRHAKGRTRNANMYKSHCVYGHPFDDENTIVLQADGWRQCRVCQRRRDKERNVRRRALRAARNQT